MEVLGCERPVGAVVGAAEQRRVDPAAELRGAAQQVRAVLREHPQRDRLPLDLRSGQGPEVRVALLVGARCRQARRRGEQKRLRHAPGRMVRQAPGADPPVGDEGAEGADDLREGLVVVLDMGPVEVDTLDAEALEAALERPVHDLRRKALEIVGEAFGPVRLGADLGAERDGSAGVGAQPAADQRFALATESGGVLGEVVVVGSVQPAPAELDEAVQQGEAVAFADTGAQVHGAERRERRSGRKDG